MFLGQAYVQFELWTGQPAPRDVMRGVGATAMNVVLVGYRGTGKTACATRLAQRLGLTRISLDAEIERKAGQSIPDIVSERGWPGFRDLEEEVVARRLCGRRFGHRLRWRRGRTGSQFPRVVPGRPGDLAERFACHHRAANSRRYTTPLTNRQQELYRRSQRGARAAHAVVRASGPRACGHRPSAGRRCRGPHRGRGCNS